MGVVQHSGIQWIPIAKRNGRKADAVNTNILGTLSYFFGVKRRMRGHFQTNIIEETVTLKLFLLSLYFLKMNKCYCVKYFAE